MSSRTVCDRCGRDCTPPMRRSMVHLTELQFATGHDHPVAEDSYYPVDLCDICTDVIKEALGKALRFAQKMEAPEIGFDSVMLTNRAGPPTLEARERVDIPADHPGEPLPRAEL